MTPRWVVDSEKFNEWMNPADYTTPQAEAEMEAAQRAGEVGQAAWGAGRGGVLAGKCCIDVCGVKALHLYSFCFLKKVKHTVLRLRRRWRRLAGGL